MAIDAALEDVSSGRTIAVPEHLRDAHYSGAKKLGHGEGYKYAHDGKDILCAQDYLGADKIYYEPTEQGVEKKIKERVEKWRAQFSKLRKTKINHGWKNQTRIKNESSLRNIRVALKNFSPEDAGGGIRRALRKG